MNHIAPKSNKEPPNIVSVADLVESHPRMNEPVIDGYLRRGETLNLIASPKVGKSWLVFLLAFAVATGRKWLGSLCTRGRVLLIDNELHPETLAARMRCMQTALEEPQPDIDVLSLRGQSVDILKLLELLSTIEAGSYSLIVLDAFYRFLPQGTSENDNAAMMGVYNTLDAIAKRTGAAVAVVHHSSKGAQGNKAQTDVGAGAGAISRAADTHLTIRPHEESGYFVLEAVTRSFRAPDAKTIFFDFPLWQESALAPSLAPDRKSAQEEKQQRTDSETKTMLLAVLKGKKLTDSQLRGRTGFGASRVGRGLSLLRSEGAIESKTVRKKGSKRRVEIHSLTAAPG
jgi:hypothetical protein